jgi:hypothetical protein
MGKISGEDGSLAASYSAALSGSWNAGGSTGLVVDHGRSFVGIPLEGKKIPWSLLPFAS